MTPRALNPSWLQWPQTQHLISVFGVEEGCLRFVGGAVRDALLGIEAKDVDAATTLLPEAVMAVLQSAGIQAIPTGIRHGTVTAVVDGRHFEITTLRRDKACDGRHAEVEYTEDWEADASRRDFTMNALYLSPQGELYDYHGGIDDARKGYVRFIGDASERITEDYLRILRFFRFYAHYGKGIPDPAALAACVQESPHLTSLSGERVQHELLRLLAAPHASHTIAIMHEHALFPQVLGFDISSCLIFPRFEAIESLLQVSPDPAFKLSGWVVNATISLPEALGMVYSHLRLSNRTEKMLRQCVRYYSDITPDLSVPEQKRLIRKLGAEFFRDAVILAWAQGNDAISGSSVFHAMLVLARQWQIPAFPLTGNDLVSRGLRPGKELGALLARLEEKWEASDYALGKEDLLKEI